MHAHPLVPVAADNTVWCRANRGGRICPGAGSECAVTRGGPSERQTIDAVFLDQAAEGTTILTGLARTLRHVPLVLAKERFDVRPLERLEHARARFAKASGGLTRRMLGRQPQMFGPDHGPGAEHHRPLDHV